MKSLIISRPEKDEYARYYDGYVSLVEGEDVISALKKQMAETKELLAAISEEKAGFRYAEDKWSIKQLLGHLIDTERVFAYRALRISRADRTPLAGFEQNEYIANTDFDACCLSDLAEEFEMVRRANILMFQHMPADAWMRRGIASENEVTVRALAYMTAGHELHHLNVLKDRYLI